MPQVPNSERENNILSYGHFQVFVSEFSLIYWHNLFTVKKCQLTISGIVNCSVWFVDIYDPKRIFQEIVIKTTASTVLCEM